MNTTALLLPLAAALFALGLGACKQAEDLEASADAISLQVTGMT